MNILVKLLLFMMILPMSSHVLAQSRGSKVKYFKSPLRELSVILTDEGYYPNRLMAYVGEKVRFFITSTKDKSECFVLQDHKVFLSAKKGEVSEGEVIFKASGKYKFYCPSTKNEGFITVIERNSDVEEQKREIASESSAPGYWVPRDYDE